MFSESCTFIVLLLLCSILAQTIAAKKEKPSSGDDRFKLTGFNKNAINQLGPINEKWSKNGWTLRYQRDWATNITLKWTKRSDSVTIEKQASSAVNQNWTFGKVEIHISKQPSGEINENWNFGKFKYKFSKLPSGQVDINWSKGKSRKKLLAKYQKLIDAWCAENSFLIGWAHCVIYSTERY